MTNAELRGKRVERAPCEGSFHGDCLHDCARDGHVWGGWKGVPGQQLVRRCAFGCVEFSELPPLPPPAPRMMVCSKPCGMRKWCRPHGEHHEERDTCKNPCPNGATCVPYTPRYRPWTPEEACGKVVTDGKRYEIVTAVYQEDARPGIWIAEMEYSTRYTLGDLFAELRQADGTPAGAMVDE